jgi:dienelactone hydrolase
MSREFLIPTDLIPTGRLALVAAAFAFSLLPLRVQADPQGIVEESLRIPMVEAGKNGLEAVMVRPDDSSPHPLALIAHGTPRDADALPQMTALQFVPHAREFARRGWTAVVVLRRGYGTSGGGYSEDAHSCSSHPAYYESARASTQDLRAAVAYLSSRPEVDTSRFITVGVSAGGLATVALTADPPPGLVAAISFAGGRGSRKPDEVCNPDDLIRAFSRLGKTSRIPMLWVYSENDHFFGPKIAAQLYRAFTGSGGSASFVHAAAFRQDGHGLFSASGIPIWTAMVDEFLSAEHLQWRTDLLPLPSAPDVRPPWQLSASGRDEFRVYLTYPPNRAFAVSPDGHYGYSYGRQTEKEAQKAAADHCKEAAGKSASCTLLADPRG